MGKKSKSKTGKGKHKGGKRASAAKASTADKRKLASTAPPAGATCWLCLDENTQEEPLVRDCACRGASGWAHVDCLVSYCKHKSGDAVENLWSNTNYNDKMFCCVWQFCPCCKQKHANFLLLALSQAGLSFLADKYPGREEKTLPGLGMVLDAVMLLLHAKHRDDDIKDLGRTTAEKMIAISGESHPGSQLPHIHLAQLEHSKGTRPALRQAIHHWEQVKVCCSRGDYFAKATADKQIKDIKISLGEEEPEKDKTIGPNLQLAEKMLSHVAKKDMQDTPDSIGTARILAMSLFGEGRCIEAQRLLADTLRRSQRVFGSDHWDTKETESFLKLFGTRNVAILPKISERFEALEFNEATGAYLVKGPILEPRIEDKETARMVPGDRLVLMNPGTPVTCVGLKNAIHLNGKLGDAGKFADLKNLRYPVTFEDKALGTKLVKWENLRIVFDVPETNKVEEGA